MKEAYIRFMAPVIPQTADQLFRTVDQLVAAGYERIHLSISSPGGSVFHGLSIYNFLKGLPTEVYTYNFGSVDSIASVIFSSGSKRFSVPHARFLLHGVTLTLPGNIGFDEKALEESLKSLQIDQANIAKVIADTCGKELGAVEKDMNDRTALNPVQAKQYGLVTEIKSELFPAGGQLINIYEPQQQQMMLNPAASFQIPSMPVNGADTIPDSN